MSMSISLPRLFAGDLGRCTRCGMRFAWINLGVNLGMAILKASVGALADSEALMVSSLYSLNDVLSAAAVLVSFKMASRPPDKNHPFGYGKVEFLAVGLVSLVLAASMCFFVYAIVSILKGSESGPNVVVLLVALLSFGTSEFLARKGFCVAHHLDSPALDTSAEHNRADAVSSAAVVLGTLGAFCGLHILDRLVAIYEAADIMHLGGKFLGRALKGLMDSALPADDVELVRAACLKVPGVTGVKSLRTRRSGAEIWVDAVVLVPEHFSVEAASEVTHQVRTVIRHALGPQVRAQVGFRAQRAAESVVETVGDHA
jgi:cation diffusion facilitator family transporter